MCLLKPLENMAKDLKQGDLVRIFLDSSNYVGYRWALDKTQVRRQLIFTEDADIIFSSIDPYGVTKLRSNYCQEKQPKNKNKASRVITEYIQFVGVNLSTRKLGNEPIRGYQILERTQYEE